MGGCGSNPELFENAGVFTDDDLNRKVSAALNVNRESLRADKERLLEYIYFLFLEKNYNIILQNIQTITKRKIISQKQEVGLSDLAVLMSFLAEKFQELKDQEEQIIKEREIVLQKLNALEIKINPPNSLMIKDAMEGNFKKKPESVPPKYEAEPQPKEHTSRPLIKDVSLTRQYQSSLTRVIKNRKSSKPQEIQMSPYTPTDVADSFARPLDCYYLPERAADLKPEIEDESENLDQKVDFFKERIQGMQNQVLRLNQINEQLTKQNEKLAFQNTRLLDEINIKSEEKGSINSTNDSKLVDKEQREIAEFKKRVESLESELKTLSLQKVKKMERLGIAKGNEISILNYKETPAVDQPSFIEVADPNLKEEAVNLEDPHKKDRSFSIMFNLFSNSKILPNHKEFQTAVGVRQILAEMFSEKVRSTELLYAYDHINPLHYEKYIKTAEDIMLLIKLPNGYIIGGFAGKLEGNEVADSFIFSLNPHREPIKLTPSSKINRINRDSAYLSFGFDEISIKSRSLSVVCNVSGFRTIFAQKGRNVHIESFLGFEKREFTAQAFEIYQINFKTNEDLKSVMF